MSEILIQNAGLLDGYNKITSMEDEGENSTPQTKMEFGILNLRPDSQYILKKSCEKAILLILGKVQLKWAEESKVIERKSYLDENPSVLLAPSSVTVTISTFEESAELAIFQTKNENQYSARFFSASNILNEQFGKGTLRETSTRDVRTIFDKNNMPESNLVLGEVVNYPGKWSSYPPHGHNQPEIYHYRFSPVQGFGFAMDGNETAHVVKNGDTLVILDGVPHSQTSAPGYAMYYIWAIRHLDGDPYGPQEPRKFLPEHKWVMDPKNNSKIWPPIKNK